MGRDLRVAERRGIASVLSLSLFSSASPSLFLVWWVAGASALLTLPAPLRSGALSIAAGRRGGGEAKGGRGIGLCAGQMPSTTAFSSSLGWLSRTLSSAAARCVLLGTRVRATARPGGQPRLSKGREGDGGRGKHDGQFPHCPFRSLTHTHTHTHSLFVRGSQQCPQQNAQSAAVRRHAAQPVRRLLLRL